MTRDRDFKRRIRRRMAATGERYTVARHALLVGSPPPSATSRGGESVMSTRTSITVQLATDDVTEREAETKLREVLDRWTLDNYIHFEFVRIDANASEPSSFPTPTFPPATLTGDAEDVLTAFLHAQVHWALNEIPGARGAIDAAAEFVEDDGHPACATSNAATHYVIGVLERQALRALTGAHQATTAEDAFVERHGLVLPGAPPNADRRAEAISFGPDGPLVTLEMGQRQELALAERLRDLHGRYDLRPWRFSPQVRIQSVGPPNAAGAVPSLTTYFLFWDDVDVVMNYIQMQASWWGRQQPVAALEAIFAPVLADAGVPGDAPAPRSALLAVAFACAVAYAAAAQLFGEHTARQAGERHPRNQVLYRACAERAVDIVAATHRHGIATEAP